MSQDMLGAVSVHEARGIVADLLEKLGGKNGREEWLDSSKRFLRREDPWPQPLQANLKNDWRKDGWKLLEHKPRRIVFVSDLEFVPFLRKGEQSVRGYDLIGRSRYDPALGGGFGQEDAEFILEHQDELPGDLQGSYLVFTETLWWDPGGYLSVVYLSAAMADAGTSTATGSRTTLTRLIVFPASVASSFPGKHGFWKIQTLGSSDTWPSATRSSGAVFIVCPEYPTVLLRG